MTGGDGQPKKSSFQRLCFETSSDVTAIMSARGDQRECSTDFSSFSDQQKRSWLKIYIVLSIHIPHALSGFQWRIAIEEFALTADL